MACRDLVVIGASAGGLPALLDVVRPLPVDLPAAILIVLHTPARTGGFLPNILERGGAWNVAYAIDNEAIVRGRIYLAPPDYHLLVRPGRLRVARGPRENRFRPAIDPLFRTAARAYGPRVIGVVLSGGLDDGTHGLALIKRHGGLALAQDPEEADLASMPLSAIQNVEVDYILKAEDIGAKLPHLVAQHVSTPETAFEEERTDVAEGRETSIEEITRPPAPFTCPDCGGSMWEYEDGNVLSYRCHVGHGYTANSFGVAQQETLESTLWTAPRALEEQAALRRRMAVHALHVGRDPDARRFEREAKDAELRAATIRQMLFRKPQEK